MSLIKESTMLPPPEKYCTIVSAETVSIKFYLGISLA
jgi:hypothetical protein